MENKTSATSYSQFWKTAYYWLKGCGFQPDTRFCREEMVAHPDYPSLLSLTDLLDSGRMAYKAVSTDATHTQDFNYPLLAHINQPGNERVFIIWNPKGWDSQKEIRDYWSGIVIFPELHTHWHCAGNTDYQRKELKSKSGILLAAVIGIFLLALSAFRIGNSLAGAFGLLSLAGLGFGLIAASVELGIQSEIVKQFCSTVSEGGCTKVLRSRYAAGLAGITPADGAVIYFAAQFSGFVLASLNPSLLSGIFFPALAAPVVIIWSLYTQAFKLKDWCALCLAIAMVLALQFSIVLMHRVPWTGFFPELVFLFLLTISALVFLPVKGLLKSKMADNMKLAELKKWKMDPLLFLNQLRQEGKVDTSSWDDELVLGSANAALEITVACNPYCGPCARAHLELDRIMEGHGSRIKLQMRFLYSRTDENDRRKLAVRSILQSAASISDVKQKQEMLSDWFAWMDYDRWSKKWRPDTAIKVGDRMEQHLEWIAQNKITQTPTLFINGRKLPGRYTIGDLERLIPHVADSMSVEGVN